MNTTILRNKITRPGYYKKRMRYFDALKRQWVFIFNTTGILPAVEKIRRYSRKAEWYDKRIEK